MATRLLIATAIKPIGGNLWHGECDEEHDDGDDDDHGIDDDE